jgi:hypothetical protein
MFVIKENLLNQEYIYIETHIYIDMIDPVLIHLKNYLKKTPTRSGAIHLS